jgi:hypothetical protein
MLTITADAVVALSKAIDAARRRGETDEEIRLASLRGAQLNRWLLAHGYPPLRVTTSEHKKIQGQCDRGNAKRHRARKSWSPAF